MNSELTFRLAQTSDFDEILKLSEGVYDGQDYLPLRFHKWMQMINVAVMLAHTSGKLIGLVQCSVVDDGRTAVRRAARISPEFRGQGVYKRLSEAMNEFVRRHYPAVQREMFTSTMCHFPAREITEMRSIRTSAVNKSLFALDSLKVNFSDQVEPCMKEYLCDVIFTSPFARRLFPYNSIILDWIPMEPLRSNIDHFQHEIGHEFYFAVDKCGGDAIPRSVSFGVLSPRKRRNRSHKEFLLHGPVDLVPPGIFDLICEQSIFDSTLKTKGSAGPSGMDAELYRRILCSKNFAEEGKTQREDRYSDEKPAKLQLQPLPT
ncbi:putative N-acetyltransferase 16 [Stylophora pistillata]|uniref:Putative N-acetyltransferase 16 n=1 Tax=Stylophora pistillata TaxID=50429 RepID=A0A2B4RA60_STYPI|nr:putative N-acetyltransferase 16 [Stylophora pistillata]